MRHTATRAPRFDREWKEMIDLLPESRRSVMEQAIRDYQLTGIEPDGLDGAEMMAFLLIKKIVDRRAKQRNARIIRRNRLQFSSNSVSSHEAYKQVADATNCQTTAEASATAKQSKPTRPKGAKQSRHEPYAKNSQRRPSLTERQRLIVKRLNRRNPKPHKR